MIKHVNSEVDVFFVNTHWRLYTENTNSKNSTKADLPESLPISASLAEQNALILAFVPDFIDLGGGKWTCRVAVLAHFESEHKSLDKNQTNN